jgi:hypothetical protein
MRMKSWSFCAERMKYFESLRGEDMERVLVGMGHKRVDVRGEYFILFTNQHFIKYSTYHPPMQCHHRTGKQYQH